MDGLPLQSQTEPCAPEDKLDLSLLQSSAMDPPSDEGWFGRTHWRNYHSVRSLVHPRESSRLGLLPERSCHARSCDLPILGRVSRRLCASTERPLLPEHFAADMALSSSSSSRRAGSRVTIPTAASGQQHTHSTTDLCAPCTEPSALPSAGDPPRRSVPLDTKYNLDTFTKAILNKLAQNRPMGKGSHRVYADSSREVAKDYCSKHEAKHYADSRYPLAPPKDQVSTWSFNPDLTPSDLQHAPLRVAKSQHHRSKKVSVNAVKLTLDEGENQWRHKIEMLGDDPISWRLKHVIHADVEEKVPEKLLRKRVHSAKLFDFDVTSSSETELQRLQQEIAGENSWLSYIKEQSIKKNCSHEHISRQFLKLTGKQHPERHAAPTSLKDDPKKSIAECLPPERESSSDNCAVSKDTQPLTVVNHASLDTNKLELIQNFLQDVQGQSKRAPRASAKSQRMPLFGIKDSADSSSHHLVKEDAASSKEELEDDANLIKLPDIQSVISSHTLERSSANSKATYAASMSSRMGTLMRSNLSANKVSEKSLKITPLEEVKKNGVRPIPEEHLQKYLKYVENFLITLIWNSNDTVSAYNHSWHASRFVEYLHLSCFLLLRLF